MCIKCDHDETGQANPGHGADRRSFLASGTAALLSAPMLGSQRASAASASIQSRGLATTGGSAPLKPYDFTRRALRPDDILIDILYVGICHSDIHTARGDWGPIDYRLVPGHEIVGKVAAVGSAVSRFKVGDHAGIGCMVDSCGTCDYCERGLEQFCTQGFTGTYGKSPGGLVTQGGYANNIVVREKFAITIPQALDIRSAAPLLCAGVTTYSPMQHWKVGQDAKVALLGLGGLGHVALKLFKARGADVTVFTTTPGKQADARRMGASQVVLWDDKAAFARLKGQFDFILSTVPTDYDVDPFVDLLRVDGTLVNVGVFNRIGAASGGYSNAGLILGRRSLAASLIGGIAETQQVIDYCAANKIAPEVEVIPVSRVNEAWDRVVGKQVRYRYVIDMRTLAA
jgi:uncharacterized zinc-type alcohol dehydrogenase-like protein